MLPLLPNIGIVILAAGASTRLGHPKQLLVWQGISLIRRAVLSALSAGARAVTVVLGAHAAAIRKEIADCDILIVENPDWQTGMGGSLRVGIQALLNAHPESEAALIMLADQPLLTANHLQHLMAQYCNQAANYSIVGSFYNEKIGVPAIFDQKWFVALQQFSDDQGARALLRQYADQTLTIPFPAGELDIDTAADWELLHENS